MRKHLSAETIDVGLYVLPRGALRSELVTALGQACALTYLEHVSIRFDHARPTQNFSFVIHSSPRRHTPIIPMSHGN